MSRNRRDCLAVFVSHLAEEVRRSAETSVRVDGIEVSGLDENNNLVVDRSPRYKPPGPHSGADPGPAVLTTEGQEQEFYLRLLANFR